MGFETPWVQRPTYLGGAAIAQWIRHRLPSCRPGFESQARHLCFHQLYNVEMAKINKKRPGLAHFLIRPTNCSCPHLEYLQM